MAKLPIDFYIDDLQTSIFTQEKINDAFQKYCKKHYNQGLNYYLLWWGVDDEYQVIDIEFSTTEKGLPIQPRTDRPLSMNLPFESIK